MKTTFKIVSHNFDVCVVGGGMSGVCAAIASARHGAKTALVQDRPVLGGNASSEIRMWICGAGGENRETGIIDEIMLENQYRNPYKNYFIWDSVLFEAVTKEPNLTLFLNTSCLDGEADTNRLNSILCWQLTSQTYHKITANVFVDCSGDSILAPISSAEFSVGRESKEQTGENMAHTEQDNHTMGNSCIMQFREFNEERAFTPPSFAKKLTDEDLHGINPDLKSDYENFWYLELGGMQNTIEDAEEINRNLYSLAFGMWDYIKNESKNKDLHKNYDLEFVGAIAGKRESRRYVGDYILSEQDILSGGHFDDIIAYGGWPLDDHDPGGFFDKTQPPNRAYDVPSPFGIPYRSIYSKNVQNLMCAGRNISCTHIGMSSTRVMATCSILGQAAGTAAAMAVSAKETPKDILSHIGDLQQTLMDDGCYIPFFERKVNISDCTVNSDMKDVENLLNGFDRAIGENDNGAYGEIGCFAEFKLAKPTVASTLRIVLDSDLTYKHGNSFEKTVGKNMLASYRLSQEKCTVPKTLVKDLTITFTYSDGSVSTVSVKDNHQRQLNIGIEKEIKSFKICFENTNGYDKVHVFSVDIL